MSERIYITNSKAKLSPLFLLERAGRSVYSLPAAVCIYDLVLEKPEYVNREYTELTGHSESRAMAWTRDDFLGLIHPEDRLTFMNHLKTLARDGLMPWHKLEYRFRTFSGAWLWCLSEMRIFERAPDGTPIKGIEVFFDITRQKNKEIRLEELETAVNESSIVAETDASGRITSVNDMFCEVSGYERCELIGQTHKVVNSGYHPKSFFTEMWETIKSGRHWRGAIRNRAKDGSFYWVDTTITPFYGSDGKISKYLSLRRLLNKEKELEKQLESQLEATTGATAISNMKSRFISELSHEVRSYLNCIVGFSDILSESAIGPNREYLSRIKNATDNVVHLMNDVLEAVRLESSHIALSEEPFHLREILSGAVQLSERMAKEKGLKLEVTIGEDVPDIVIGDAHRLSQVFMNLLSNAIKYTEQGKIAFHVIGVGALPGGKVQMNFSVSDTGRGIPEDKLKDLFQDFVQCSFKDTQRGSGLGLAIARRIVELMGGRIWLESQPMQGTTAFVTVAFRVPLTATNPSQPASPG